MNLSLTPQFQAWSTRCIRIIFYKRTAIEELNDLTGKRFTNSNFFWRDGGSLQFDDGSVQLDNIGYMFLVAFLDQDLNELGWKALLPLKVPIRFLFDPRITPRPCLMTPMPGVNLSTIGPNDLTATGADCSRTWSRRGSLMVCCDCVEHHCTYDALMKM
jgi:hypothetical protein